MCTGLIYLLHLLYNKYILIIILYIKSSCNNQQLIIVIIIITTTKMLIMNNNNNNNDNNNYTHIYIFINQLNKLLLSFFHGFNIYIINQPWLHIYVITLKCVYDHINTFIMITFTLLPQFTSYHLDFAIYKYIYLYICISLYR